MFINRLPVDKVRRIRELNVSIWLSNSPAGKLCNLLNKILMVSKILFPDLFFNYLIELLG